jgi:hypothetical protein
MVSPSRPSSLKRSTLTPLAAVFAAACMVQAQALPVLDASPDFLPSYAGPKDADLDVVLADVVIDPRAQTITFSATMKGNINKLSPKLYVFGVDRGAGTVGTNLVFNGALGGEPKIGSGVRWDSALALTAAGQALFFDALNPGLVPLPNVAVTVSGNQISATAPLSLFPSQGFQLKDYAYNLWPRSELSLANTVVSDFAPDHSDAPVSIAGKRFRFDLLRSAKAVAANCLVSASAEVRLRSEGTVDVMEVSVQGLPPATAFGVFVTQVPNAPFGLSWYQGELETNAQGRGKQSFIGRFNEESFIVAPNAAPAPQLHLSAIPDAQLGPATGPVHTFHLGLWFNSPADAVKAGCPGEVTPFNGTHDAGIQVLSSRNFGDANGPLINLKP